MPGPVDASRPGSRHAALALVFLAALPALAAYTAAARLLGVWEWLHAKGWRLATFRALSWAGGGLLLLAAILLRHVHLDRSHLPDPRPLVRFEPQTIGEVYDAEGHVLVELAREYRRVVGYSDLPPVVRQAILAAEDKNFFRHDGVDYSAFPRVVFRAVTHTLSASRRASDGAGALRLVVSLPQGGSTLTQQLVRAYFLHDLTRREREPELLSRTAAAWLLGRLVGVHNANRLTRKLEEIRLALWIEHELHWRLGSRRRAKEDILARYASFVYLGQGRYGLAAASEYYFGVPLASYGPDDADKAALLAGITKSPAAYAPSETNLERPLARRNQVLRLMAAAGYLTPEEAARLQRKPIVLAPRSTVKTVAPAAVSAVLKEIARRGGPSLSVERLLEGRIHVHSTVNGDLQRVVNEALEDGLQQYEARHPEGQGLVQGSVVVLANRDARILAVSGGRRVYNDRRVAYSDLNRVTQSRRQPGSALKPLVYLAAFEGGVSLDTTVPDAPIPVSMGRNRPPKWISNYDDTFKGLIPVRQALAESRNAPTVWLAQHVGIDRVLETARALGIRTPLGRYPTTALGAAEVTLLELANAYRAIASGKLAEPHVVERVVDSAGAVLFERKPDVLPLPIKAPALARMQEGLRSVVRLPGGTAHALASSTLPLMGKTGTTSDFRDALFVGSSYGPEGITVAVWVGYDDNRPLGARETGARTALPIFGQIVERAYESQLVGLAAPFPRSMETGIDTYVARHRQEHADQVAKNALAEPKGGS